MNNILIVGAGAAGLMAASLLGRAGFGVTVVEKNEKAGKKIYITGKGRCNFTNACDVPEFLRNVVKNPRFLYSALYGFSPDDAISFFEDMGVRTKVERGRRAFPESDHSADIIDALREAVRRGRGKILFNTEVTELVIRDGRACGLKVKDASGERILHGDAVAVATGGLSYPSTGSTGDGYAFAKSAGHNVTELRPSLVPMNCAGEMPKILQGLSLKNVELKVRSGKKVIYSGFGEMMFTHFGITGPLVLEASALIGDRIGREKLTASVDLKPAVDEDQFRRRLISVFEEKGKKSLRNALSGIYPASMIPAILLVSGIDGDRTANSITKEERERIVGATREFPLEITSLRGYNEAVVTRGGVEVKEIDPSTMESKMIDGLYFIGEVLDLDAFTGGYNLQIAWSTAAACAGGISEKYG